MSINLTIPNNMLILALIRVESLDMRIPCLRAEMLHYGMQACDLKE